MRLKGYSTATNQNTFVVYRELQPHQLSVLTLLDAAEVDITPISQTTLVWSSSDLSSSAPTPNSLSTPHRACMTPSLTMASYSWDPQAIPVQWVRLKHCCISCWFLTPARPGAIRKVIKLFPRWATPSYKHHSGKFYVPGEPMQRGKK